MLEHRPSGLGFDRVDVVRGKSFAPIGASLIRDQRKLRILERQLDLTFGETAHAPQLRNDRRTVGLLERDVGRLSQSKHDVRHHANGSLNNIAGHIASVLTGHGFVQILPRPLEVERVSDACSQFVWVGVGTPENRFLCSGQRLSKRLDTIEQPRPVVVSVVLATKQRHVDERRGKIGGLTERQVDGVADYVANDGDRGHDRSLHKRHEEISSGRRIDPGDRLVENNIRFHAKRVGHVDAVKCALNIGWIVASESGAPFNTSSGRSVLSDLVLIHRSAELIDLLRSHRLALVLLKRLGD